MVLFIHSLRFKVSVRGSLEPLFLLHPTSSSLQYIVPIFQLVVYVADLTIRGDHFPHTQIKWRSGELKSVLYYLYRESQSCPTLCHRASLTLFANLLEGIF